MYDYSDEYYGGKYCTTAPWNKYVLYIKSVIINDSVTSIGAYAFYNCTSVKSVTVPASVTAMSAYAFLDCNSIIGVYITDLAAWCNKSFSDSRSNPLSYARNLYLKGELVENLVIPDTVTSIGCYTFYECTNLVSVTIPDSVTNIGNAAFCTCTSLVSVSIAILLQV